MQHDHRQKTQSAASSMQANVQQESGELAHHPCMAHIVALYTQNGGLHRFSFLTRGIIHLQKLANQRRIFPLCFTAKVKFPDSLASHSPFLTQTSLKVLVQISVKETSRELDLQKQMLWASSGQHLRSGFWVLRKLDVLIRASTEALDTARFRNQMFLSWPPSMQKGLEDVQWM